MGRSNSSMLYAYLKDGDNVERYSPLKAIKEREEGKLEGKVLYCPNYIKQGCIAELKVVNGDTPHFSLKPNKQAHIPSCRLYHEYTPLVERIRALTKEIKLIIDIDDYDFFSPTNKNTTYKKQNTNTSNIKKVGELESEIVKKYTKSEYIRSVSDLHEFYQTATKQEIARVRSELVQNKALFTTNHYEEIINNLPGKTKTFIIEGFIDSRNLKLLKEKGYIYLYKTAYLDKTSIRFMLVYNGNGKKRFIETVEQLLLWIMNRNNNEKRKMVTVKGSVLKAFNETNIILLQVKDIDIKYKMDYSHENNKEINGEFSADLIEVKNNINGSKVKKFGNNKQIIEQKGVVPSKISYNENSTVLYNREKIHREKDNLKILEKKQSSQDLKNEIHKKDGILTSILSFVKRKLWF